MRTRTSAKCFVRQYAVPVSPLCSVLSTCDQSVVPNEISAIFIVCAPRAGRGALRVRSSARLTRSSSRTVLSAFPRHASSVRGKQLRRTVRPSSLQQPMSPCVVLVSPVPIDSPRGNAITVARIAQGLRARGLDVCVRRADDHGLAEPTPGQPPALVHAFHAYRTGPLGLALARSCRAPLVITLPGTDVSDDLRESARGEVV